MSRQRTHNAWQQSHFVTAGEGVVGLKGPLRVSDEWRNQWLYYGFLLEATRPSETLQRPSKV